MGFMLKGMGATPLNMPILLIFAAAMFILAAVMFIFAMFMLPAPIMNIAALG